MTATSIVPGGVGPVCPGEESPAEEPEPQLLSKDTTLLHSKSRKRPRGDSLGHMGRLIRTLMRAFP